MRDLMIRAFEQITVTTGATRMSARSEVDNDVVRDIADELRKGDGKLWDTGWRVKLHLHPMPGAQEFVLAHHGIDIARCWLCLTREGSGALWEMATGNLPDERVTLARPKGVPWLAAAVLVTPSYLPDPFVLIECGDLERCVAWALIEEEAL